MRPGMHRWLEMMCPRFKRGWISWLKSLRVSTQHSGVLVSVLPEWKRRGKPRNNGL
ncbi:hypothetical protein BD309DRAFT_964830 [Dichomitus squalens]|nr:hypothetical protein BD309DRAFT_964830 [Dichomitus squalens]